MRGSAQPLPLVTFSSPRRLLASGTRGDSACRSSLSAQDRQGHGLGTFLIAAGSPWSCVFHRIYFCKGKNTGDLCHLAPGLPLWYLDVADSAMTAVVPRA